MTQFTLPIVALVWLAAISDPSLRAEDGPADFARKGIIEIQAGKLDDALESFQKALSLAPNDPVNHTNLGVVLEMKGRLNDAAASFSKAIELAPTVPTNYIYRAGVYITQSNIAIVPIGVPRASCLGIYLCQGTTRSALSDLGKALELLQANQKVTSPLAAKIRKRKDDDPDEMTIYVTSESYVIASRALTNINDVIPVLQNRIKTNSKLRAVVRANRYVPYSFVQPLLVALGQAGVLDITFSVVDKGDRR